MVGFGRKLWVALLLGLTLSLSALVLVACEEGGGEEGEVEDVVRAIAAAWTDKDVDGFLAGWTDKGFQEEFDASREEAEQFLPEFIGEPPITVRKFSGSEVSGNTATTQVELIFGIVLEPRRYSLVKEGDVWKIDGSEHLTLEIPNNVTATKVTQTEFAFSFDASAITSDKTIAFRVENVGQQRHELGLAKVPADFDLQKALQSEEEPEGLEEIGFIDPQDPGETTNMVFIEPLKPGRYIMACFVEDPASGTPHALLGMFAEFTIK